MESDTVNKIAIDVENAGGHLFYIGGTSRDRILKITPKDTDLEAYGLMPDELTAILSNYGKVALVGESFGVYKLGDLDIAIPRKESSTGRSHKSLDVDVDPWLDTRKACSRRDFTYNAMLENVLDGKILDYFGGQNDLRVGIVRHVDSETFVEDPLRMVRAAKFAGRFGHIVAHKTVELVRQNREGVKNLPTDRIFNEIADILMKSRKPSYGFRVLDYLGLLEVLFPELWALKAVEQNPIYHPEGNVFKHTMLAIDYFPIEERTLVEQLAYLWHDVGKIYGTKEHDRNSVKIIREVFPKHLTNNVDTLNAVTNIVDCHMQHYSGSVTKSRVRRLAAKIDIPVLVRMGQADTLSRPLETDELELRKNHLQKFLDVHEEVQNEIKPIIRGQDILDNFPEVPPGPAFRPILDAVYERQLDGEFNTHEGGMLVLESIINIWSDKRTEEN